MSTEVEANDNLEVTLDRIMSELDEATDELPEDAIRYAQSHREQITPRLIQAIRDATARAAAGDIPEGNAHFFALFLLTEFQAKEALPAILDAISLPGGLPHDLFGDAITSDLCSILAALAGDTPEVFDALMQNRSLNEYVRWGAADALMYLVRDGRMTRNEAVERLRSHLRTAIANRDAEAVGPLVIVLDPYSPHEALSDIQEAFRLGLVDDGMIGVEEIEESVSKGDSYFQRSLDNCRPTGIKDTVEALRHWATFLDEPELDLAPDFEWLESEEDYVSADAPVRLAPIRNTQPRVGRNDPCPCGSGKKYKKCCGRS